MGRSPLLSALACGLVLAGSAPALTAGQASRGSFTFELRDSSGRTHDQHAWQDARAILLFFVTPDCPVSQGYVPEMNRIRRDYVSRGVLVYGVQADRSAAEADVRRHVQEFEYEFPVLLDARHRLVEHVDATVTPEAVALTPAGRVLYSGRIDDRIPALGVRRPRATAHDLRDALDAILAGRPVVRTGPLPAGCFIARRS
jgi:peroxiredoxin